ncbi:MAG: outer membrane protein assembly factor BamB family protein [Phycisphaerales bacterium]
MTGAAWRAGVAMGGVVLVVGVCAARAPLEERHEITEPGLNPGDQLGFSAALDDGVAVVGAPNADLPGNNSSGRVYGYDTATGQRLWEFLPIDAEVPGAQIGWSVDVSGPVAIAGGRKGVAYLLDAATGAQLHRLDPPGTGDTPVAIHGDRGVVGSGNDLIVYDTASGTPLLTIPGVQADHVALHADVAIVGREFVDARLYDITTGALLQVLTQPDPTGDDWFARSVDVDGSHAIVGAMWHGGSAFNAGAAYVYDIATGAFVVKLEGDEPAAFDEFGTGVSIDGGFAVVGAAFADEAGVDGSGRAYVFELPGGQTLYELVASTPLDSAGLGCAAALDGTTVCIGACRLDPSESGPQFGGAYVYEFGALFITQPVSIAVDDGTLASFSVEVSAVSEVAYQWRRDGVALVDGGDVTGATTPTLELTASLGLVGVYDCIATVLGTDAVSASAVLGVRADGAGSCPGDIDGNGVVDSDDLSVLLGAFGGVCP